MHCERKAWALSFTVSMCSLRASEKPEGSTTSLMLVTGLGQLFEQNLDSGVSLPSEFLTNHRSMCLRAPKMAMKSCARR